MSSGQKLPPDVAELTLHNDPYLLDVCIKYHGFKITGTVASVNIPDSQEQVYLVQDESFKSTQAQLSDGKYLIFGNKKESGVIAFKLVNIQDSTVAVFASKVPNLRPSIGIGMFSGPVEVCREIGGPPI